MKNIIVLLICICLSSSCSKSSENKSQSENTEINSQSVADYAPAVSKSVSPDIDAENATVSENNEQKIIKTADMRFQVLDIKSSLEKLKAINKKFNSLNISLNENNNGNTIEANFVQRVNNADFEKLVTALQSESVYLDYKNINSQDVSEEFIDIEIRLRNKKAVENKYLDILKKATKISDILEVENQIRVIREEIEAKEGRLKYLKNQVQFSTINLSIYQKLESSLQPDISFGSKLGTAFVNGWVSLKDTLIGLIEDWPFTLFYGFIIYLIYKWWKRRNNKIK